MNIEILSWAFLINLWHKIVDVVQYNSNSPPCSFEEIQMEASVVQEVLDIITYADFLAQKHHRSLLDQLQESQQTLSEMSIGLNTANREAAHVQDYT